jgi:aldehyde:ferredoxin oxidoreductase
LEYIQEDSVLSEEKSIIQNRVLHVDLSNNDIRIETPGKEFYRKYLGGRGIGLYYVTRAVDPQVDALSPENVMVFTPGLLNGIAGPGIPKYSVTTKSPLTGGIGESEAGGFWGPALRHCGFDAIVVTGKAKHPVYLTITDGEAALEDATELWMLDTKAFQEKVHEHYPKSRVLQVGPAGANQVLFANITNDLSFFNGRNGLGAVMGSKNLRAIVAAPSSKSVEVPDPDSIKAVAKDVAGAVKQNPLSKALQDLGTAGGITAVNSGGALPTRNWKESVFEEAEQLGGDRLRDHFLQKRHGCFACPVRCKRVVKINENDIDVDPALGGPEYESIGTLGPMCGVGDMPTVCKANELCNRLGIDTMSGGATIAFAMQCFEEGLVSEDEVGYDLSFGNGESLLKMIEDIAFRRGYGDTLALGSYRVAEKLGGRAMEFCHHSRKQELPMHDARVKTGMAFQYALSPRGADHWVAQHDPFFAAEDSPGITELAGLGITSPIPKVDLGPKKVRYYYYTNNLCSGYDILGVCTLAAVARSVVKLDQILTMARASTGWNLSWYEIMKAGERANNMARMFNVRAGLGCSQDTLPHVFTENMQGGPNDGTGAIKKTQFDEAVKHFYEMAGWDQHGIPTKSKLEELEIEV